MLQDGRQTSPARKLLLFSIGIASIATPSVLARVKAVQGSAILVIKPVALPAPQILPSVMDTHPMPGMAVVASAAPGSALPPDPLEPPTASNRQATPAKSAPSALESLVGTWQGTLHAGRDLRAVITISKAEDGGYKAIFYSIDQSGNGVPATRLTLEGRTVRISILMNGGAYEGNLSSDGKSIAGTWSQGPTPLPLNLTRATPESEWSIPATNSDVAAQG